MNPVAQELLTPQEAAKWFRRSASWLRRQSDLLCLRRLGGQPLYHVDICRAYVLGKLCDLSPADLRAAQLQALRLRCALPPVES